MIMYMDTSHSLEELFHIRASQSRHSHLSCMCLFAYVYTIICIYIYIYIYDHVYGYLTFPRGALSHTSLPTSTCPTGKEGQQTL